MDGQLGKTIDVIICKFPAFSFLSSLIFLSSPSPLHEHIKVGSDMRCPGALSNMLLGLENFIFYLVMIT